MGAWLGRRSEPRVDYTEAVRVIWPGEVSGVVARAVNLSPTGILVDAPTPTPCAVGSDVLCDVTLPRGPRLLRGRVAHRRMLAPKKVGMGIEFVDLSPREVAELRDVVDESGDKPGPQRVKVQFAGTKQVVRARAVPTEEGFQLVTALPFLKPDTEVDISLAADGGASARGWVSSVALDDSDAGGAPRLLINVRLDEGDTGRGRSRDSDKTPVVESLFGGEATGEAVPEHVWEPDDLGATAEVTSFDVAAEVEEHVPTIVTAGPALPAIVAPGTDDADQTQIVQLAPRTGRWRALGGGMIAGALALLGIVAGLVATKTISPRTSPSPALAAPAIAPQVAAPAPAAPAPAAPVPAAAAVAPAPPEPTPAAEAEEPEPIAVAAPASFTVGLTGSLAGSQRYPLRDPDGVAFNLPHARATMKLGTYRPAVPGLKALWVRALPGGGAHLRFFFTSPRSAPRVELGRDAVRITARE